MTDERAFTPAHAAPPAAEDTAAERQQAPAHLADPPALFANAPTGSAAAVGASHLADPEPASPAHFAEPAHDLAEAPAPAHFAEPGAAETSLADPGATEDAAESAAYEAAALTGELLAAASAASAATDALDDEAAVAPAAEPGTTAEIDPQAVEAAISGPSPSSTAEIDVDAVEAKLSDPGSTMSFEPIRPERIDTDSTYDAGTTTQLMWGARSDVGCVRTHNEDSYLVQSPLFCVSDGMGGHAAGEVASSIAVETVARLAPKEADPARLAAAVEAANSAIIEAAANGLGKPGMGCTATCAYIENNTVAIAHVGDSRCYLVHEGTLIKVTRDHSYVEELVDAGEITADEARVHPNRSVITRALGSDPAMYADHFQLNIVEGDRLILCSDGLSSMIPDGDIESISNQSPTAQIAVDNLVDAALAAGGSDNVTVVVVDVVDDGRLRQVIARRRRNVIIAAAAVLAALAIAAIAAVTTITGSLYLGVHGDTVAIYRGVPGTFMGIDLNSVVDDTTIELEDLPEDTQRRLAEGIPQSNMDTARDTLSQYRRQIDEEQVRQVQDAQTIKSSTDEAAANGDAEPAPTDAAETDVQDLTDTVAPTEGGDA